MLNALIGLLSIIEVKAQVDPTGSYLLENKLSKSQTLTMELKIKKNDYELSSHSNFKGDFIEKGSWSLSGDTLILVSETRKDVYNKKGSYNTNFKKQEYEYHKKERLRLFDDQICDLNGDRKGEGYCYIKQ